MKPPPCVEGALQLASQFEDRMLEAGQGAQPLTLLRHLSSRSSPPRRCCLLSPDWRLPRAVSATVGSPLLGLELPKPGLSLDEVANVMGDPLRNKARGVLPPARIDMV